MNLEGVPAKLERREVQAALSGLGFDIDRLRAIYFALDSVTVTVLAYQDGGPYVVGGEVAEHTLTVPILPSRP